MNGFDRVIIPVLDSENIGLLEHSVRDALGLARWLNAQPVFLVLQETAQAMSSWIEHNKRRKGGIYRSVVLVTKDLIGESLSLAAKDARSKIKSLLYLTTDRTGPFKVAHGFKEEKAFLLEKSPIPIWIASGRLRRESSAIRSLLVPMSGERKASDALDFAIRMGNLHHLPVDILHVTNPAPTSEPDESVLGQVPDQPHHEYPGMVEELIAEAAPYSSLGDRKVIRDFCHCYGSVLNELRTRLKKERDVLIVIEWKGSFHGGHAKKFKGLLNFMRGPILLIREEEKYQSNLLIGRKVSER
jgi:hypothetical protein